MGPRRTIGVTRPPGQRAATRDAELAAFCAAERRRLVRMLASRVGDSALAEELGHEALVRLCRHWEQVSEMDHRRAWLNRVAINLATTMFRRRAAAQRAMARHGAVGQTCTRDLADTIAVRQAVAELPDRMRQAIVLRHFEGMTVAEASAAMRCPGGTVKSLTSRGMQQLRQALADDDDRPPVMTARPTGRPR